MNDFVLDEFIHFIDTLILRHNISTTDLQYLLSTALVYYSPELENDNTASISIEIGDGKSVIPAYLLEVTNFQKEILMEIDPKDLTKQ